MSELLLRWKAWWGTRFGRLMPRVFPGLLSPTELLRWAWISCTVGLLETSTIVFILDDTGQKKVEGIKKGTEFINSFSISPLHLRAASEFRSCKVVHLPVEPISEERMEDVRLEHLKWDQDLLISLKLCDHS